MRCAHGHMQRMVSYEQYSFSAKSLGILVIEYPNRDELEKLLSTH
jgi:hypothetical protein